MEHQSIDASNKPSTKMTAVKDLGSLLLKGYCMLADSCNTCQVSRWSWLYFLRIRVIIS